MTPIRLFFISTMLFACSAGVSFMVFDTPAGDDKRNKPDQSGALLEELKSKKERLSELDRDVESAKEKVCLFSRKKEELTKNLNMLKQQIQKQEMAQKAKDITIEELLAELKKKPSREEFNLARELIKKNPEKGLEAAFAVLKGEPDWKARHNFALLVSGFHERMTDEQLKVLLDMYQEEEHNDIRSLLLGPIQMRKPAFGIPVYRKIFEESDDFHVRLQMAGLLCANGEEDAERWLHERYMSVVRDVDKMLLRQSIAANGSRDSLPLIHKFIDACDDYSVYVDYYIKGLVRIGDESSLDFLRDKIGSCKDENLLNLLKKAYNEIAKDEFYPVK